MQILFELEMERGRNGNRDAASNLYRQLRVAIIEGRLASGSRLPATRHAASVFGVSRNTAQAVYERLLHENLVVARRGSGTFVAPREARVATPMPSIGREPVDARLNAFWRSDALGKALGYWEQAHEASASNERLIDLRPAVIDSQLFPFDRLRQSFTRQLRRMENRPAAYRGPKGNQGNFHLRQAIERHVAVTRSVACNAEDILVTAGAQQAFDLVARILVRPGQTRVAIEDPGYPPMRVPFLAAGATIVPVPVDDKGMRVDQIPRDVQIICTCPSHHFPLGVPLSAERRLQLLDFARGANAVIVEDDYDGEFRYEGGPLTALRTYGCSDTVFYVGTFSKTMLPSLRLGFVIPPRWALSAMVAAKNAIDWHASSPLQLSVANFIEQGHLTRHVGHMRKIYGERRLAILESAASLLPPDLRALPSYHGMHLTFASAGGRVLEEIALAARARGIAVHGLARYFSGAPASEGLVMGFGAANVRELTTAVEVLGDLIARS